MKMLKKILTVLAAIIVVLIIASFFMSSHSHTQRAMVINAPAEVVFNQVNTIKNWEQWSPWYKMEPDMKITYNDVPSGTGASYSWVGKKMGKGVMTIQSSKPNESIVTRLDFGDQGNATGGFNFKPTTGGVEVEWYLDAENGMNPLKKYMSLIMSGFLKKSFDEGLTDLKKIAENMPKPEVSTPATVDTTVQ